MVTVKELEQFENYGKCVCISNGTIEAYVTVDIGPRIIRFGHIGGQNIMCQNRKAFAPKNDQRFTDYFGAGKQWENLGGHRIWTSPESYPETYYPDMDPVAFEITGDGAVFTPKPETENGVAKTMEIKMDPDDANMQVIMRVKNISDAKKQFAVWGLSVSAAGGTLIIPMNTNDTGLLSNRIISVWPYTDMSDDRIYWGKKYVTVRQDTAATQPLKLGFDLNGGQVFYLLGNEIFRKAYNTNHPCGNYPDGGCSFETYTNNAMIEIESLGELQEVLPGGESVSTENWSLLSKPCEVDVRNDDSIDRMLEKL